MKIGMKIGWNRSCAGLLLVASAWVVAVPGNFVRGRVIEADPVQMVQRVNIPQDVYEWVSRDDLGDLRVFNGAQEEVPYHVRGPAAQQEFSPWRPLPVFVLPASVGGAGADGASFNIQVDAGGAVVSVDNARAEPGQGSGFLVDLTGFSGRPSELLIGWAEGAGDFIGKFRVDASADLNRWRTLVPSTTLASLETGGHQVSMNRITLPDAAGRYLKIVQIEGSERARINAIEARSRQAQLPGRQWKTLTGVLVDDGYEFETGGRFPLDRVAVELGQESFLVVARLFSRAKAKDTWRARGQHTFYKVAVNGAMAKSEPVSVPVRDRYWRVELVNAPGQIPGMAIGWLPGEVVFLRQGPPPYLLAYGQAGLAAAQWPMRDLLARLGTVEDPEHIPPARLSAPSNLGGPGKLEAPPEPLDWQTMLLWAVLVVGVCVVGGFAFRLARSSGQD